MVGGSRRKLMGCVERTPRERGKKEVRCVRLDTEGRMRASRGAAAPDQ
jgi:hypothetical protein